jgi:hypothetical protein
VNVKARPGGRALLFRGSGGGGPAAGLVFEDEGVEEGAAATSFENAFRRGVATDRASWTCLRDQGNPAWVPYTPPCGCNGYAWLYPR